MPIDPRIPLGAFGGGSTQQFDPMQTLAQVSAMQNMQQRRLVDQQELELRRQQTESQIQQRDEAIAKAQREAAAAEQKAADDKRLSERLSSGQPVTQAELYRLVTDPTRATAIGQGIETLRKIQQENVTDVRAAAVQLLGGVMALPPDKQAEGWMAARQGGIAMGFDASNIPETFDPDWTRSSLRSLLSPKEQIEAGQPDYQSFPAGQPVYDKNAPVTPGVAPTPAFTTPAAVPEAGSEEDAVARWAREHGNIPVEAVPLAIVNQIRRQRAQATQLPSQAAPSYVWATKPDGTAVRATDAEIRANGWQPVATGTNMDRDSLVVAVINNPGLWDQIPPSERAKIAGDLHEKGFTGFGRPLPEAAVTKLSSTNAALQELEHLKTKIRDNQQYLGPIAGFQALNPYSDARKMRAALDLSRQQTGSALEHGVLREGDWNKYKIILGGLYDTPEQALAKTQGVIDSLTRERDEYVHQQRLAGRRVESTGGAAEDKGAAGGEVVEWEMGPDGPRKKVKK